MNSHNREFYCIKCDTGIEQKVHAYSLKNYQHPLCRPCQNWFEDILEWSTATDESINLFFALLRRGVPALLEKNDGYKTIDIAVPDAKVNIEVDGVHHNYDERQAKSDLQRTLHSFKKGYYTLRIPNSLARNELEYTADKITEFLMVSRKRTRNYYY